MKPVPVIPVQGISMFENKKSKAVTFHYKPPNNITYKLRDPKTGLFLSSYSNYSGVRFNTSGETWASLKTINRKWGDYNLYRLLQNEDAPRVEIAKFKVTLTEQKAPGDVEPDLYLTAVYSVVTKDRSRPRPLRPPGSANEKRLGNIPHAVNEFVRAMADDHFAFKFIFMISDAGKFDITIPDNLDIRTMAYDGYSLNRRKADSHENHLIAVKSDKDYVFLKLMFSDYNLTIYDNVAIIAEYDAIRSAGADDDLF